MVMALTLTFLFFSGSSLMFSGYINRATLPALFIPAVAGILICIKDVA